MVHFDAILFDMDGTLVDSTEGVVGAWHTFAEAYPHLNVQEILNTSHGVRTVDNLRTHCGISDPDKLEAEAVRFEEEIVNSSRRHGVEGIVLLPGVRPIIDLLANVDTGSRKHPLWAICTSATETYAKSALQIAGIPIPPVFVTAESVSNGKPAPDPYLLGAKLCGVDPSRCLVIEDAPAGITSGQAAGCKTMAVVTSHSLEAMKSCKPDFLVRNLSDITVNLSEQGVDLTIVAESDQVLQ